jgi:sugar phosphate permease
VAVTVYYALSAGCIVLVGGFIDRHGPRGVLTYGVVTMAAAVAALGLITAPWQLFVVYLVLATSWSCLSLTGISSTILPWFGRRQGLAMTLALTGASVGGMVLVPILIALVQHRGFQFATAAAGAASLGIGLPLVLLVIRGRPFAHDVAVELQRYGATSPSDDGTRQARLWTRQEVLRVPLLWTLMVPFALALAAQVGFIVHQISLLEPYLGESRAALTVSATTVAALLGRIVLGVLSDRGAQGVALAVMATWPSTAVFVAGSLVFGLGVGNLITLPPPPGPRRVRPALLRHRVRTGSRDRPGRRRTRPRPDGPIARRAGELPAGALVSGGTGEPRGRRSARGKSSTPLTTVLAAPRLHRRGRTPWPRRAPGF